MLQPSVIDSVASKNFNSKMAMDASARIQNPNAHVGEPANVNQDISFISIKAALANLRVPASLAVPTDKTGIKKADQSQHNLITKKLQGIQRQ